MLPTITILGKTIAPYPICAIIGIFVSGIYACYTTKKRGYNENNMLFLLLWAAVGTLVGGAVLYAIVSLPSVISMLAVSNIPFSFSLLVQLLFLLLGGSVFYGGLLGGILAGFIYVKVAKLDIQVFSSLAAPAIPLFHIFGRIGCFLGGCCYGVACPVGFIYHHSPVAEANGVQRFPVQLLEAAFNLALFLLLHWLGKKGANKKTPNLLLLYLLLYSVGRFLLEFLRDDAYRGIWGPFSTSQWISIVLFIVSAFLLYKNRQRQKDLPAANAGT